MQELQAVVACSPKELSFTGTSEIALNGGINAPNLTGGSSFPKCGVLSNNTVPNGSLNSTESGSTASHASLDSKSGIFFTCPFPFFFFFLGLFYIMK